MEPIANDTAGFEESARSEESKALTQWCVDTLKKIAEKAIDKGELGSATVAINTLSQFSYQL